LEELLIQLLFPLKYFVLILKTNIFFFHRNQQFKRSGESFDRPEDGLQRDPEHQGTSKSSDMFSIVQDFDFEAAERLSSRIQSSNLRKGDERRRSRSRSRSPVSQTPKSNRDGKHKTSCPLMTSDKW